MDYKSFRQQIDELTFQIKADAVFIAMYRRQLAAANARIAELEAQVNAVPVEAIRKYCLTSDPVKPTPFDEDEWNARRDAESVVCEWLSDTVQP